MLKKEEASGNHTARLALLEEVKDLPYGAVWDRYCEQQGVPVGRGVARPGDGVRAHRARSRGGSMDLSELIEVSRFFGRGSDFTIAGGGNTSVKDSSRIVIKASGAGLSGITEVGLRGAVP